MKKATTTIIAVILFAAATNLWGCIMTSSLKKNMEEHLRVKYGKEFVLNEPRLVGGDWVRPATTYVSRGAYPVDNPELKFDISWDKKDPTYRDTYLVVKWSTEGRKAMERKLQEVYGEGNYFIRKYWSGWYDVNDQRFK